MEKTVTAYGRFDVKKIAEARPHYINSASGQQAPISTLVTSVTKVAPRVVNHQGQFPSVTRSEMFFNCATPYSSQAYR
jgi:multidrug efflux pump subunit AcrB